MSERVFNQSHGDAEPILAQADGAYTAPAGKSFGVPAYRGYVLMALTLVYTLNFVDRTMLSVVGQPVIDTFHLSDSRYGFLNGPPFAIFYAIMGIPIAIAADRRNRVVLIAVCIALWSIMAALCGFATSFLFLLFARIGVAIGEAGCTPAANSLIGDYFNTKSRGNALGIYATGVTLGSAVAYGFGGGIAAQLSGTSARHWLEAVHLSWAAGTLDWARVEGWRLAFVLVGAPGMLIALLVLLTIKEPPRGYSDPPGAPRVEKGSLREALGELASKPSFWTMTLAASIAALVGYGLTGFQAPMAQRVHGVSAGRFAAEFGIPLSLAAAAGTFLGGALTDRLTPRWGSAPAWVPAIGLLVAIPLYIVSFYLPTENLQLARFIWCAAALSHYTYLSAQYSIGQGVVSVRFRASAIAVLLFVIALIGNGLGPQTVGWLSDFFMHREIARLGFADILNNSICRAPDLSNLADVQAAACRLAYREGLRLSMAVTTLFFIPAAGLFLLTAVNYQKDLVSKPLRAPHAPSRRDAGRLEVDSVSGG